jgi:RNA polymerase sigma-70 factor (ECF subfamily)
VVSESSARRYALRDPDVRLMLEVRDDNAAAFEELMLRYQGRLVTVLEHLVGSRDSAEDLSQEVFLRVYRARKRYVPGAKFSTWLFTIANNVASNALRSKSRRREVSLDVRESGPLGARPLEGLVPASSGQIPARQLDKTEMRDIVRLALEALNERQRMAVLLSKFEGMSYADIAQTMELTPQAIKSLLSRARVNLREVLEPYLERGDPPAPKNRAGP